MFWSCNPLELKLTHWLVKSLRQTAPPRKGFGDVPPEHLAPRLLRSFLARTSQLSWAVCWDFLGWLNGFFFQTVHLKW